MRLHAEVDVVNRQNLCLFLNVFSIGDNDRQLAAQGMKKSGKRSKSQLAIGRKPLAEGGQEVFSSSPYLVSLSDQVFLMLSNLSNKAGVKYLIKDNVGNLFTRMIGEGKATIRYTNDLYLL